MEEHQQSVQQPGVTGHVVNRPEPNAVNRFINFTMGYGVADYNHLYIRTPNGNRIITDPEAAAAILKAVTEAVEGYCGP
ncbi:hypothetical protein [Streptomyces sp. NBC_01180]|uniref:hypothetical protein n=1 Tax=Streptomyces sp. NBC_01180 TaxID=2903763 RepID=UPI0038697298|nr:hypothetical protein OG708_08920 [Streptomyces sp. NBC_01180]